MVAAEIVEDIGGLLLRLGESGFRPIDSLYERQAFGNYFVDVDGPFRFRIVRDRLEYSIEPVELIRGSTLDRVFTDKQEFANAVLSWAAHG